jgi:hypothetical protein
MMCGSLSNLLLFIFFFCLLYKQRGKNGRRRREKEMRVENCSYEVTKPVSSFQLILLLPFQNQLVIIMRSRINESLRLIASLFDKETSREKEKNFGLGI